jgi:4-hydroxybenzoyl-CoA thioesterase
MAIQPPELRFLVSFDEADSEGIVFFGNYFRLAHRALEQWLPLIGVPWAVWFSSSEYGVPLRHVEADYLGPMRPGEEFIARVGVERLGESSVVFGYEFVIGERVVARLKTAHVFVAREGGGGGKIAIPAEIRARLAAAAASSKP